MQTANKNNSVEKLVLCAVLTALVVILQLLGAFIRFGPFSISLVLIPIVIGATTCGTLASAWLGFVFGIVVLINGDTAPFLAINVPGTIITVLTKGVACGLAAGAAFNLTNKLLSKCTERKLARLKRDFNLCQSCEPNICRYLSRNNKYIAVLVSALACPIANTGVFLIGCSVFFLDALRDWAVAAGLGGGLVHYIIFGLVGGNFLFEIASNIVLSPIVVRLLNIRNKKF